MIRITLDDVTRERLNALRRNDLPAKARDRLEMVTLSDAGWSAPRIASHLGSCAPTVRGTLKDFQRRGADALFPRRTGPAPDLARRGRVTDSLSRLLAEDRTWTSRQLSAGLHGSGIAIGPRQVRRYLALLDAGYRRTATTVAHKQDPARAARAAKVLGGLKKKRRRAG
jgi:putative transposase